MKKEILKIGLNISANVTFKSSKVSNPKKLFQQSQCERRNGK